MNKSTLTMLYMLSNAKYRTFPSGSMNALRIGGTIAAKYSDIFPPSAILIPGKSKPRISFHRPKARETWNDARYPREPKEPSRPDLSQLPRRHLAQLCNDIMQLFGILRDSCLSNWCGARGQRSRPQAMSDSSSPCLSRSRAACFLTSYVLSQSAL